MPWENLDSNLGGRLFLAAIFAVLFVFCFLLVLRRSQRGNEQATTTEQISRVPLAVGKIYPLPDDGKVKLSFRVDKLGKADALFGTLIVQLPQGAEPVGIQRDFEDGRWVWHLGFCIVFKHNDRLKTYTRDMSDESDEWPRIEGYIVAINEIEVEVAA